MKLSCKDVCLVVSESLDRELSLRERLSVKIHLLMCKACQRMARQMELLRTASRRLGSVEDGESRPKQEKTLSKEASDRILERLRHTGHDHANHE
jgi:predicted anti-sigma-YlaC factor YlaD